MSEFVLDSEIKKYFADIASIPHGSYHEEKLVAYLQQFAESHQLKYCLQPTNNIIVFADATEGYEDHKTVMLQAHIDMVCEKEADCPINFETDPLQLYQEEGWLKAKGTTLGADDGYGVAWMLAILADQQLKHPALECVFTSCEEVGLVGAKQIDTSVLKAERMINLDTGGETVTCVSCSGGRRVEITREVMIKDNEAPTYQLTIDGLQGGHSGGLIAYERANAVKLAFRVLRNLNRNGKHIRLVNGHGGAKENAIARQCIVQFSTSDIIDISQDVKDIQVELANCDPDVSITLQQIDTAPKAMCPVCSRKVIEMVDLLPYGLIHKDLKMNLPNASLNLGVFEVKENTVYFKYSVRSPLVSYREMITNQIRDIVEIFDGEVNVQNDYHGWNYEENSEMRKLLAQVLENHGKTLTTRATHGGLETGVFKGKMPDLDIITYGPISHGEHTPKEQMDLGSFERSYQILCELLEKC